MSNKDTLVQVIHDSISIAQDCDYMDSSELVESLRLLATQTAILANCMIEMQNKSSKTNPQIKTATVDGMKIQYKDYGKHVGIKSVTEDRSIIT